MKNFLIIVLGLGLAGSAFLTRPDREEFERYVRLHSESSSESFLGIDRNLKNLDVDSALENVEFKDFYLWTVVRKDGKTLYTGVFDRWIDNEKVKAVIPS
jgi:hypothetical protein